MLEKHSPLQVEPNKMREIVESFSGEWLVGDEHEGLRADDDGAHWDAGAEWSVARTHKGKLAVYLRHCNARLFTPDLEIYDTFEEMVAATEEHGTPSIPQNVLAATAAALGLDYKIELDI